MPSLVASDGIAVRLLADKSTIVGNVDGAEALNKERRIKLQIRAMNSREIRP